MPSRRRAMDRKDFNLCSTPETGTKPRLSSISVSAIDTNSSSDGIRKRKALENEISPPKRAIKRRKRAKVVLRNVKENKRSKSKKATLSMNYDSEWLTESEQESCVQQNSPNSDSVLFKDLPELECIREAYHAVDDSLNTSFLEPCHEEGKELEKIGVEVDYEPLQTVSHLPLRINDADDEEEEFVLKRKVESREYLGRQPRKPVSPKCKSKQWIMIPKFPTALSNMLWDNYMRDHPTEMSMLQTHAREPNISRNKNEQNDANSAAEPIGKLWPELRIPPGMEVTRGTIHKQSKKWTRKYDVYKFTESEDDESELISLREYRRKRNEKMSCSKIVKPRITSIKTLKEIRYIKHGENWRIVRNP